MDLNVSSVNLANNYNYSKTQNVGFKSNVYRVPIKQEVEWARYKFGQKAEAFMTKLRKFFGKRNIVNKKKSYIPNRLLEIQKREMTPEVYKEWLNKRITKELEIGKIDVNPDEIADIEIFNVNGICDEITGKMLPGRKILASCSQTPVYDAAGNLKCYVENSPLSINQIRFYDKDKRAIKIIDVDKNGKRTLEDVYMDNRIFEGNEKTVNYSYGDALEMRYLKPGSYKGLRLMYGK